MTLHFKRMPENPLLEVAALVVEFTSGGQIIRAVDHLSFVMHGAETLALVGESGSGKSVTALSILRLLPAPPGRVAHGQVLLSRGEKSPADLIRLPEREMRGIRGKEISMIFQEPMTSLNPVFSCGNQVAEILEVHLRLSGSAARERVIQLFGEVMLPEPCAIFDAYPHQLSGGQKQRVMIAMAIACDPAVLIADEPTTALDVTVQKGILELLKRIQERRRMGILFITHDLGLVKGFADRVLVMYKGKGVEQGSVDQIFNRPVHPYTRGLIACRAPLDVRLKYLPTIDEFMGQGEPISREVITSQQREADHRKIYACKPVLKVERVSKEYTARRGFFSRKRDGVFALRDISLSVYPGETLGIVGESGCGKTTLARVMLELIPASAGRIFYGDTEITTLTFREMKRLRKELQIIFQDPYSSLNPRIPIGPAIMEPMQVHHLHGKTDGRKRKAIELLEKVGLDHTHFFRYPHEFSGGQRQRICIARALAVEPRVIICDESVSALDVSIQAQVLNLLNEMKREFGLTYIFISHDLSVVKYISDRIIVMHKGKIEEMGDADAVYAAPKSEYTRLLLESIPR